MSKQNTQGKKEPTTKVMGKSSKSAKSSKLPKVTKSVKPNPKPSNTKFPLIYFDNNATTTICKDAEKALNKWLNSYNPSTDSKIAQPAKEMIENAKHYVLRHCRVTIDDYLVVFTSGATESNCLILRSTVRAYRQKLKQLDPTGTIKPHIITSSIEHHSTLECLAILESDGDIEVSYVQPNIYGRILPESVKQHIKPNTCLISIMYANNEIGSINDIPKIGKLAHDNKIPLHTDCVQVFGKYRINLQDNNIDAVSASFHKFYGPRGLGLLILNRKFVESYGLHGEINGTQQDGLRGGTENVPAVAAGIAALEYAFQDRKEKNIHLLDLRNSLISMLDEKLYLGDYVNYVMAEIPVETPSILDEDKSSEKKSVDNDVKKDFECVIMGPPLEETSHYLPNTLYISFAKNKGLPFCNVELKKFLDKYNIVVSIGSACNTSSPKASHVLEAIRAPPVIKRGIIRISFGDHNTKSEVKKFVKVLIEAIKKQTADIV